MAEIYKIRITKQAREQMTEFPERYQLIDEEPWRNEGIRKIAVSNFLIYYWINESEKIVQIIAVIYSGRAQLEQLREL